MRIYIASHDREAAQTVAQQLANAGHLIVSYWHDGEMYKPADADEWRMRAEHNFAQIRVTDALVLIGGTALYPGGKYVEAGYANGQGIQVYNLGEVGNGMMHFATRVNDVADLIQTLGQ